jgi:hypothetical protein
MPDTNEVWVVIRNCVWIQEAQVVKSLLEANGFEVLIPDEYFLGAQPHYGIAVGGARVMVQSTDLDQASAILAAMELSQADTEGPDGNEVG